MTAHDPAWDELWAEARNVDMLALAERLGAKLKRAGPDYIGPCPLGCAEKDGFVVTPAKHLFLCRPSGAVGDAVDMAVHVRGVPKADALAFVTGKEIPSPTAGPAGPAGRPDPAQAPTRRAEAQGLQPSAAAPGKRQRDEDAIAAALKRALPIAGTHAEAYLRARGLNPQKRLTADLRFVAELDYWIAGDRDARPERIATLPAMLGVIRNVSGAMIGIHRTYLDPERPSKWTPPSGGGAKKFRGEAKGGLIRLGVTGDKLAVGEGIETTLAWYALGCGPEDVSVACGLSLGNMAGSCTGTIPHPTAVGRDGKPTRISNGEPDMAKPGMILPNWVRELILLGDGDSEPLATRALILAAGRRFRAEGLVVSVHFAPAGKDWLNVHAERALAEGRL
jgi:CHC2-type zinc finger protein